MSILEILLYPVRGPLSKYADKKRAERELELHKKRTDRPWKEAAEANKEQAWLWEINKRQKNSAATHKRGAENKPPPAPKEAKYPEQMGYCWRSRFIKLCESPAERSFLEAAIDEFSLFPKGGILQGKVTIAMQKNISGMRVDFVVNNRLVVEIDGHAYHSSRKQVRKDALRDKRLREEGYSILRITAHRVFSAPEAAIADVKERIGLI